MSDQTISIDRLSEAITEGMIDVDPDGVLIVLALYRLLSRGDPVWPSQVADESGVELSVVEERLASWPGVFRQDGTVIGFWGLALPEMAHRFEVDGKTLYTWCAYDAIFLPELIGKPARGTSKDPVTGEQVSLRVHPDRIEDVIHKEVFISFLDPTSTRFDENVILNFCNYVHFFASKVSGTNWTADHPGTFLLTLDEAFQLSRLVNRAKFGVSLKAGESAKGGAR
jgi:alkylmercury lyase